MFGASLSIAGCWQNVFKVILRPLTFVSSSKSHSNVLIRLSGQNLDIFFSSSRPKIKIKNRPTLNVYTSDSDSLRKDMGLRVSFVKEKKDMRKGGGFYDKLGADIDTKHPIQSALAIFIDRSGRFLVWRHNITRTIPKIGDCSVQSA